MKPGQGFARRVTLDNLAKFRPLLRTAKFGSEEESTPEVDPAYEEAEQMFQGDPIQVDLQFEKPPTTSPEMSAAEPPAPPEIESALPEVEPTLPAAPARGPVVWRKELHASDVQRQRGNPTGGLRLTQEKFRDSHDELMDWTTYFRRTLFGAFPWTPRPGRTPREGTHVQFDITVLGEHWGPFVLQISDKPSGEAGQGNYTSFLHWGELSGRIRDADLVGRQLTLFGPVPGAAQPFFIEIV